MQPRFTARDRGEPLTFAPTHVRAPCGTRQLGNPSSPCGHRNWSPHGVGAACASPGIPRGCEGSETSRSDTRAESERGGASLSLPSWSYHHRGGPLVVVPPPRGNLSPVSRPPVSAPLRLARRARDGHDRSHHGQRAGRRMWLWLTRELVTPSISTALKGPPLRVNFTERARNGPRACREIRALCVRSSARSLPPWVRSPSRGADGAAACGAALALLALA